MTLIDARHRFEKRRRSEADMLRDHARALRQDADAIDRLADDLAAEPSQLQLPITGGER